MGTLIAIALLAVPLVTNFGPKVMAKINGVGDPFKDVENLMKYFAESGDETGLKLVKDCGKAVFEAVANKYTVEMKKGNK